MRFAQGEVGSASDPTGLEFLSLQLWYCLSPRDDLKVVPQMVPQMVPQVAPQMAPKGDESGSKILKYPS